MLTKCYEVTSFLNLLSLYHDTLLTRRLRHIQQTDPKTAKSLLPPSPHTRYTKEWSEREPKYKWASRLLEIIRCTQLVFEMGLRRTAGNNGRWRGIVIIEMIRCLELSIKLSQWGLTSCDVQSNPPTHHHASDTSTGHLAATT